MAPMIEISNFESIILISYGGRLTEKALPISEQTSSIKSSLINQDIITIKNHYPVEVAVLLEGRLRYTFNHS